MEDQQMLGLETDPATTNRAGHGRSDIVNDRLSHRLDRRLESTNYRSRPQDFGVCDEVRWQGNRQLFGNSSSDHSQLAGDSTSIPSSTYIRTKFKSWTYIYRIAVVLILLTLCTTPVKAQSDAQPVQNMEVSEDALPGTIVGTVRGDDYGPPYDRIVRTQTTDNRTINSFDVDLSTGVITTKDYLDREELDSHTIIVSTGNIYIIVNIVVLDVNDMAPTFMKTSHSDEVSESAPKDYKIPLGSVRDKDLGTNSTQDIRIISGNGDGDFALEVRTSSTVDKILDLVVTNNGLDYERTTEYVLVVRATDGGGLYSEMTVHISVLDQNDNEPTFNPSTYSVRVKENVTVGEEITVVEATDNDSGDNSRISYSIDPRTDPEEYFSVDATSGSVRVNKPLDYETKDRFTLNVEARDHGNSPLTGTMALDVIVENINEAPANISLQFEAAFAGGFVLENTPVNTVVARVIIDDTDVAISTSDRQVTLYKDEGYFGLRDSSGSQKELIITSQLDRETTAVLDMTLQVTDNGNPPLRASHAFKITIGDVNDNGPIFTSSTYTAEVKETVAIGKEVIRVSAEDKDDGANGRVTYYLKDGTQHMGWFAVDSVTGAVTTRAQLDCELSPQPVLVVVAADSGDPPRMSSAQVIISVGDVNDKEPEFETSFYSIKVAENRRIGDCIITVTATDPECGSNSPVTYKMAPMLMPLKEFRIDESSGMICLEEALDYETTSTYQFQVEAVDSDNLSTQAVVQVEVTDVNDNYPKFEPLEYLINVMRGAQPGLELVTVQARDADSGDLGTVTYSLVGGSSVGYFDVDASTGAVTLIQSLPEDNANPVFDVRIRATDGGGLTSLEDALVRVSVISDDVAPPVFSPTMFNFTISESVDIGTMVGQVQATISTEDASEDDVEIKYTILYQSEDWFMLDQLHGQIYAMAELDREKHPFVIISVQAEAHFPPVYARAQVNVTILDVNDNAPYFPATTPLELEVREDEGPDEVIFSAKAFDKDLGNNGTVHYHLHQVDDAGLDNPRFIIGSTSGEISLVGNLDYEDKKQYQLVVVAEDQGTPAALSANMTLTVKIKDVNDNPPVFTEDLYVMNVAENIQVGSPIDAVLANDADSDNNALISYSLQDLYDAGDPNYWGSVTSMFGIGSVDGIVMARDTLDRELREEYEFLVVATDHGSPESKSATATVRIIVEDVNDNVPEFNRVEYRFALRENADATAFVGRVMASDRDSGDNGLLYYYMGPAAGTVNDDSAYFTITAETGEIKTRDSLDREAQAEFVLQVYASDKGPSPAQTATALVKITVEDDNDNAPKFLRASPFKFNVTENRPKGTLVTTLVAEDLDEGSNGLVLYYFDTSLSEQAALANFEIHPQTGKVTTLEVLDFETRQSYLLTVVAQDNGIDFRSTTATMTISVQDTNDQSPLFQAREVFFEAVEGIPEGTVVGRVEAEDGDTGDNGLIKYYLVGGNVFSCFSVDQDSGEIITVRALDYEEASSHQLSIRAEDSSASLPRSSNITVIIEVIDVNDNAPKFEQDPVIIGTVAENTPRDVVVHRFMATDRDTGLNGTVSYSIDSYSGQEEGLGPYFDIDPQTGELYVVGTIDFEQVDTITVIIQAKDSCPDLSCVLHSLITTIVFVTDENDNAPRFESTNQLIVSEDEPIGYVVLVIVAVDPDSNMDGSGNNVVRYRIVSGNDDGKFALGSETGHLSIYDALDYERRSSYTLNISAEDAGLPKRISHQSLVITVEDSNDNAPVFKQSVYHADVVENAEPETSVVTVEATDADTGPNGELTYIIPNGIAEDKFAVDPKTGLLTTKERLDREYKDMYIVTVYVNDGAYPTHYSSVTVLVTVLDENDNNPEFKISSHAISIPENRPQVALLSVVASDKDLDDNGRLTYTLTGEGSGTLFSVDPQFGTLSCQALDREASAGGLYTLTVIATDHGDQPLSASATVVVTVLDENDNSPQFSQSAYTKSIPEDIALNQVILTVSATDPDSDENGQVLYFLGNDTEGFFEIDSSTGEIFTSSVFDREKVSSYSFLIMAADQSVSGPRNQTARVSVDISDVNDNPPVFREVPYKAELNVNSPSTYSFLTVVAYDADSGNNGLVVYTLLEEDGTGAVSTPDSLKYFRIDPTTGEVYVQSSLQPGHFSILVKASDSAPDPQDRLSTIGILEVQVGDAATGAPQFTFTQYGAYSVWLFENSPKDTLVTEVQAVLSPPSLEATVYSFASGNENDAFTMNAATGVVRVNDPDKIDYETAPRIRLILAATNGNYHTYGQLWVNLTDLNDNAPKFSQSKYVSAIWENNEPQTETYVTQVIARDADSGLNGEVVYKIIDGNKDDVFTISPSYTGIVHTHIDAAPLDYDSNPEGYRLTIQASDGGNPAKTSTCILVITIVDENDNVPYFPELDPPHVSESRDVGYTVTTVKANDADLNPILEYDFTTDGNLDGTFALDRSTGRLTLAKPLDYETKKSYSVGITVSDGVPNHDQTQWLDVIVDDENDNAPKFSQQSYEVALPEQTGPNQSVLTVVATDEDSGRNAEISYSMSSTPIDSFYINAFSGTIYTSTQISFSSSESIIQLVVIAKDNGTSPQSSMVAVHVQITDVNKYTPSFSQTNGYEAYMSELAQKGFPVVQVSATDADISQYGDNINYQLTGPGSSLFYIHQRTGQITYNGGADYEDQNHRHFDLTVIATDRGVPPKNASVPVIIHVEDENDNAPRFVEEAGYSIYLDESYPSDSVFLVVSATDADSGSNANISYSITSGNSEGIFQNHHTDGGLLIMKGMSLDYETHSTHRLIMRAMDCYGCPTGSPVLSSFVTVDIHVLDVNEFEPSFPIKHYVEEVYEKEPIGTPVFKAYANDGDGGEMGAVTYSLMSEDDYELFDLNPTTGEVSTRDVFDYEAYSSQKYFYLTIIAMDQGSKMDTADVTIRLADLDESAPVLSASKYVFEVPGSAKAGDFVGQIKANDSDKGEAGKLVYQFLYPSAYFRIDSQSGNISVAVTLHEDPPEGSSKKRRRRSLSRVKRALTSDTEDLVIIVSSGLENSKYDTANCSIQVDRSCVDCAAPIRAVQSSSSMDGGILAGIIVGCILFVILVVIVFLFLIYRKRKPDKAKNYSSDSTLNLDIPPLPSDRSYADVIRPSHGHVNNHLNHFDPLGGGGGSMHLIGSDASDQSHNSASSGRGSAEAEDDEEDEDEEIRRINSNSQLHSSQAFRQKAMPDSGIQHDDDTLSEPSATTHQEYLANLGIDSSKIGRARMPLPQIPVKPAHAVIAGHSKKLGRSAESMNHFTDEGGGEGGVDTDLDRAMTDLETDDEVAAAVAAEAATLEARTAHGMNFHEPDTHNVGSLSNVVNSEEVNGGSYNWDYLIDWGPQYQPLAHVFSEIAKLKDESITPKKQPVKTVPQRQYSSSLKQPQVRTVPPPIITNAPPMSITLDPIGRDEPLDAAHGSVAHPANVQFAPQPLQRSVPIPHHENHGHNHNHHHHMHHHHHHNHHNHGNSGHHYHHPNGHLHFSDDNEAASISPNARAHHQYPHHFHHNHNHHQHQHHHHHHPSPRMGVHNQPPTPPSNPPPPLHHHHLHQQQRQRQQQQQQQQQDHQQASSNGSRSQPNSTHASTMNVSLPSLPRSPFSYESSMTSAVMTPSLTPSLSPLATRSPSVSPVVSSGHTSGHTTPGKSGSHQKLQSKKPRTTSNSHSISSNSDREFTI